MAAPAILLLSQQNVVWLIVVLAIATVALTVWFAWRLLTEPRTPENQTNLAWALFIVLTGGLGAVAWLIWLLLTRKKHGAPSTTGKAA